jgi:hypothetical protein
MVKLNTFDRREYLDHDWRMTHAKESLAVKKVLGGQFFKRRTESSQRRINRIGVLGIRPDKEVEVFGRPGLRVKGHRVAAHDQVFNFVGVEDGQEFVEVGIHQE